MIGKEMTSEEVVVWLDSLAPWETFFTGTTRYAASCRSLKNSYERFMKNNYRSLSYVYSLEPHGHGGFHVHSMFDKQTHVNWKQFWEKWYKRYGRARTEPIRHQANVGSYVTKYIMKGWDASREEMVGDPYRDRNERNEVWWNVKISAHQLKLV